MAESLIAVLLLNILVLSFMLNFVVTTFHFAVVRLRPKWGLSPYNRCLSGTNLFLKESVKKNFHSTPGNRARSSCFQLSKRLPCQRGRRRRLAAPGYLAARAVSRARASCKAWTAASPGLR